MYNKKNKRSNLAQVSWPSWLIDSDSTHMSCCRRSLHICVGRSTCARRQPSVRQRQLQCAATRWMKGNKRRGDEWFNSHLWLFSTHRSYFWLFRFNRKRLLFLKKKLEKVHLILKKFTNLKKNQWVWRKCLTTILVTPRFERRCFPFFDVGASSPPNFTSLNRHRFFVSLVCWWRAPLHLPMHSSLYRHLLHRCHCHHPSAASSASRW